MSFHSIYNQPAAHEQVLPSVRHAAARLHLSEIRTRKLVTPEKQVLLLNFPVLMDNGTHKSFEAYYIIHTSVADTSGGMLYFGPDISMQGVRDEAVFRSLQYALTGIRSGGSAAGILCDPLLLSERERERLAQSYLTALSEVFRRDRYRNPDQAIGALLRTYAPGAGRSLSALATGLHLPSDRTVPAVAEGRGLGIVSVLTLAQSGIEPHRARAVLTGFGAAALETARLLQERGVRIIAWGDSSSAYYDPQGIDAAAFAAWHGGNRSGTPAPARPGNPAELLHTGADILIPGDPHSFRLTAADAGLIRASVIMETTGQPLSRAAAGALSARGVRIVPALLAHCGPSVYRHLSDSAKDNNGMLRIRVADAQFTDLISDVLERVFRYAQSEHTDWTQAAYMLAIQALNPERGNLFSVRETEESRGYGAEAPPLRKRTCTATLS